MIRKQNNMLIIHIKYPTRINTNKISKNFIGTHRIENANITGWRLANDIRLEEYG